MFHILVLHGCGRHDLETTPESKQSQLEDNHYAMMTSDELKVRLLANYNKRSEEQDPNNSVSSPVLAARW